MPMAEMKCKGFALALLVKSLLILKQLVTWPVLCFEEKIYNNINQFKLKIRHRYKFENWSTHS